MSGIDRVPLTVVDSLEGVREQALAMYANEIPGAQVHEDVMREFGCVAVLEEIEGAPESMGEAPILFTSVFSGEGHLVPHLHRGRRGISAHVSEDVRAKDAVELALSIYEDPSDHIHIYGSAKELHKKKYTGNGMSDVPPEELSGPIFVGDLVPRRMTFFGEGNFRRSKAATHYFRRDNEFPGNWVRFSSAAADRTNPARSRDLNAVLKKYVAFKEADEFTEMLAAGERVPEIFFDHPGRYVTAEELKQAKLQLGIK